VRLLVTGGSGLVGGHVLEAARRSWDVTAAVHSRPLDIEGIRTFPLDLESEKSIIHCVEQTQPDAVIHAAAWADLDRCERNPEKAFRINTTATQVFTEAALQYRFRLVFVSSDMVFDGSHPPYREEDEPHPVNVYGRSKLAAERFLQAIDTTAVAARSALVYGKPVTGGTSFSEKVLAQIRETGQARLFRDQYRTPILAQSLAEALLELAKNELRGIIHLGGAERIDRYTFGLRLAKLKGIDPGCITPVSFRDASLIAPRPQDVSFDISLAQRLLQTPLPGYREGLKQA